ncbi:hypothetical protein BJX96DRAFT_158073 [Aspergillus floccosus]
MKFSGCCSMCVLYVSRMCSAANGDTRRWLWLLDESIRSCQVPGWHDEEIDGPITRARSYARPRIGVVHVWRLHMSLCQQ